MRFPVGKTPVQWLTDQGIPSSEINDVLKTFDPKSALTVNIYQAPHTFLRFHGARSRKRIYEPNYWADGTALASAFERAGQFNGFLSDAEIKNIAKNYYRELTAICHNWNDLVVNEIWVITLRGSESVEGVEGPAASQPTFDADSRAGNPASSSLLSGGGIQVYLNPKTPFICTPINW